MPEYRKIVHGETYHEIFETPDGWIVVVAEVNVVGGTVQMLNFLIEPMDVPYLSVGMKHLFEISRMVLDRIIREGYTGLEIQGKRISVANPGRAVKIRRKA